MSTYQPAKTQYLDNPDSANTIYAHRIIGPLSPTASTSPNDTPLLFLPHYRDPMNLIDPLLIKSLATSRPVLLIDYEGTGKSTGKVASTAGESALRILTVLKIAQYTKIDVLGFSVVSRIARLVTLNARDNGTGITVRKLIIADGTANPVEGNGIQAPSPHRAEQILKLAAGPEIPFETFHTLFLVRMRWGQATQLSTFDSIEGSKWDEGSWDRLPSFDIPVLVANGSDDYMVPTVNSFVTARRIPKAKAIIYPNLGHGFFYQYAEEFAADAERFLTAVA